MDKKQLRNTLMLMACAFIWGTAFVAQSVGSDYMGPYTFLASRSWLACAFGQQACRLGIAAYYTTATRLFEELSLCRTDGTLAKKRRQLSRLPLLIIDDLGIGGIDPQIGPILLEIFDQQSQEGALIITSQYPPEKWYDLFGDPTIADAILDRVVHRSHSINLKGESMRKVRAKKEEK